MKQTVQKIFLGLAILVLMVVPLLTLFGPHQSTSYYEQRWLAGTPEPSAETVLNGEFFTALETFYQDHIFGRDPLQLS